jgi:GR25 family glycosyltransferase involved in LPS biosynthesis
MIIYLRRHDLYRTLAGWRLKIYYSHETAKPKLSVVPLDCTFFILLERDIKRKKWVEQQLARTDLPAPRRIFPAIDGKMLKERDFESLYQTGVVSKKGLKRLKTGEIGCMLSHRAIWQKIAEDPSIEVALVLEDDADLVPEFSSTWEKISPSIPNDFDMLFIYNYPEKTSLFETEISHVYRPLYTYCFHGYVISKKGAKKILAQLFPLRKPVDTAVDRLYMKHFRFWRVVMYGLRLKHYDMEEDRLYLYVVQPDLLKTIEASTNIQDTPLLL